MQSLSLVAAVVHGAPCQFSDPARFSLAHGGKGRHPFCALKTYDETMDFLRTTLDSAKTGDNDKLDGFRWLERFARQVETQLAPQADFEATVAHEKAISQARSAGARCSTIARARGREGCSRA